MVSESVLFVFRSSRRENRELSNQGTVEGTALMWNGQRYVWSEMWDGRLHN